MDSQQKTGTRWMWLKVSALAGITVVCIVISVFWAGQRRWLTCVSPAQRTTGLALTLDYPADWRILTNRYNQYSHTHDVISVEIAQRPPARWRLWLASHLPSWPGIRRSERHIECDLVLLRIDDKAFEKELSYNNQRSFAAMNSYKLLAVRRYQHALGPAIDSTFLMTDGLGRSVQRHYVSIFHRTAKPHVYAGIGAQYGTDPKYSQDIDRDFGEIIPRIRLIAMPNVPARQ